MGFLSRLFGGGRNADAKPEVEMVSLVVLLSEPISPGVEATRKHLDSVFTGAFLPVNDDSFVVEGSNPFQLMLKSVVPSNSGMFMANFVPRPYADFSGLELAAFDKNHLRRIKEHGAWVSIDEIATFGAKDDCYRFIGKSLAALVPSDAIAVVHPHSQTLIPFDLQVRKQLGSENVLSSLGIEA